MVTRETSITAGLSALGLGAYLACVPRLVDYADLLATEGHRLGLIGEREVDRIVPRHILESCAVLPFIANAASFVEVGPGAGLPGIPLAVLSGVPAVLVESKARAAGFLREAIARLGLDVTIVQSPGELAARGALRESADAVVARALAPPPVALELTLPFARVGGIVLLLVGPTAEGTGKELAGVARLLGGGPPAYHSVEVAGVSAGSWVMIVGKVVQTPERYPRRPGVPRRRPLGSGVTGVE